jgi:8-oxo-dGTP diphosphatase
MDKQHIADDLFWCGVKVVLKNNDDKILLLQKTVKGKDIWELPGGRIKVGETELDALHRELAEETGIVTLNKVHHVTMLISQYRLTNEQQQVGLIFSIFGGSVCSNAVTLSDDHKNYMWATQDEAMQLVGNAYGNIFGI